VLSGFLITGLLVNGDIRPGGLLGFYARRMRRLLPAALVVLVVTAAAWTAVASSVEREPVIGDIRSAALYFANWHFAANATDYFASADAPSPVVHFWSLSAEEQFYVVWPALLAIVLTLCRGNVRLGRRWVYGLAAMLAATSLASLTIATRHGSSRAYFGTDGRAYQLLAGALLALWASGRANATHVRRRGRVVPQLIQVVTLAGLVAAASSSVDLGSTARGEGAVALTVSLLWALHREPRGIAGRVLSWSIPTYLGRISYSTYLWHWPVILLVRRFAEAGPQYVFIVAMTVSVGLASLSYRILEQPIRMSRALAARARLVVAAGLIASVGVGLVVAPRLLGSDRHPAVVPIATGVIGVAGTNPNPGGAQPRGAGSQPRGGALPTGNGSAPRTRTPVPSGSTLKHAGASHTKRTCLEQIGRLGCLAHQGSGPSVLVIGDSHLEALFPVFDDLAVKHSLNLYTWMYYVCPWERSVLPHGSNAAPCRGNKADLYDSVLPAIHPDVVITVNRGYDDPNLPRGVFVDDHPDQTDPGTVLSASMAADAGSLLGFTKRLVVIEPWPSLKFDQRDCLARATFDEQCRARAAGKSRSERAIEAVAAKDGRVVTVDLDRVVCPQLPVCDPVVNGVVAHRDQDHLTLDFAKAIEPALDERLSAAGAFTD
jgi:peptidoglycan/LPS O-acetylase OafA/YrhL